MNKFVRVLIVTCLFCCLVLIRAFEYNLFYDPFLAYFKSDHLSQSLPNILPVKLFLSYLFRFSLNTIISVLILKISFENNSYIKTIISFYSLAFVVLSVLFFFLISSRVEVTYLLPFYVRRFIIQPLFVLILFPFLYVLKSRDHFNLE